MNDKKDELKAALVDVRRAYRLLHAYHQRLQDLLRATHDFLESNNFEFKHWSPSNVVRLPQSTKPFFVGQWAWDLTPSYMVQCSWNRSDNKSAHQIYVQAIADTGYESFVGGEPNPLMFESAGTSRSEIRVGLYRTGTTKPDWGAAWHLLSGKADRTNGDVHVVTVGKDEYSHRYFDVDMVDLANEHAVKERLLDPMRAWIEGK